MIATRRWVAIVRALIAASCLVAILVTVQVAVAMGPALQSVEIDVDIRHGEMTSLDNGALHLTFIQVDEDSRCPREVDCVWQGQAVATIHVVADGQDHGDVALTLASQPPNDSAPVATVGAYDLRLDALSPYPMSSQPSPPEQYVATVHIKRR
jgi:hypothetical protein